MKPKLIILSDLWGNIDSKWIKFYAKNLVHFEIKLYSCCEIAEIDSQNKTEKEIHNEFIEFGIEKAIENLLKLETDEINVLAFSVGGTIAWKAALKGFKIASLYAVSSTRLRYETTVPNCESMLFFGDGDSNKPNTDWFAKTKLPFEIIKNKNHDLYSDGDFIRKLCEMILINRVLD